MKVILGPAKGKDSSTMLGPWIVNGVEIGRDLMPDMGWPFAE